MNTLPLKREPVALDQIGFGQCLRDTLFLGGAKLSMRRADMTYIVALQPNRFLIGCDEPAVA